VLFSFIILCRLNKKKREALVTLHSMNKVLK